MTSYYEEHDCQPLRSGERPNDLLHYARLLLDTGVATEMNMDFASLFGGEGKPPPTSKTFIKDLPTEKIEGASGEGLRPCPVCLGTFEEGDVSKTLPCRHAFHDKCIMPWLEKTSTCPVCRRDLPTDDPDYEEFRRQKKRQEQRQHDLDTLHDSMFS